MFCVPRVRRDLAESTLITLTSTLWHMAYCFGKGYITLEPRDKASRLNLSPIASVTSTSRENIQNKGTRCNYCPAARLLSKPQATLAGR